MSGTEPALGMWMLRSTRNDEGPPHGAVQGFLARHGGIYPPQRKRGTRNLSLAERNQDVLVQIVSNNALGG